MLADLTGPLGDRVRTGFAETSIIAQLGGSLWEIRDTWGVSKEAMAGTAPESRLECGLGEEGDQAPRHPEADMLAAHGAVTTNSRKTQQKLGKLVNQGRYAAHAVSLDQLPDTARPPGPGDPLRGYDTKAFANARDRSFQGAGATACLRARPTDSRLVQKRFQSLLKVGEKSRQKKYLVRFYR